ncbi:tail virion protein G7P-2 [Photobacterium profundum]|jgi:hypothetical protein
MTDLNPEDITKILFCVGLVICFALGAIKGGQR